MAASLSWNLLACVLLSLLVLCVAAETNTAVDPNQHSSKKIAHLQVLAQRVLANSCSAWNGAASPMAPIYCGSACAARCARSSRAKLCKRACRSCCAFCNCVPPGTAGNHDKCPCYAAITTHGGRRKCP